MPFTASHPAAILPLRRLGLPTSALVIGSIVPDLPYFLGFLPHLPERELTHSLTGVLTLDFAIGFAVFVVWHMVLTRPLVWAAPAALQRRLGPDLVGGLGSRLQDEAAVVRVWIGLLLGSLTHVVWDSFTHSGGWSVRAVPLLTTPVLGVSIQRWVHAGFSILGLLAIAWVVARWWQRTPPAGGAAPRTVAHLLLARALGLWVLLVGVEAAVGSLGAASLTGRGVVLTEGLLDLLTGVILAALVGAAAWHAVDRWRPDWLGGTATAQPSTPRDDARAR